MLWFGISERKVDRWKTEKNIKNLGKALKSQQEDIRKAAASALLDIGDSASLATLEDGLKDASRGIQQLIAEGLRQHAYRPADEKHQIIMDSLLHDKQSLVEIGEKADPYLLQMLEQMTTPDAAFAAEVFESRNWKPKTDQQKMLYFLALQKFDEVASMGEKSLPVLNNYYLQQADIQLRRKAVLAVLEADDSKLKPYLKKYIEDQDEEIANMSKARMKEIQKKEIVKQNKTRWPAFFRSPGLNSSEGDATKFIRLGMDYLENDLLFEAYCAFGIADYIYEKLTGGYVIKPGLTISDLTTQRDREIKVFGDFKLEKILAQIAEAIRGKKQQTNLIGLLLGNQNVSELNVERKTLQQMLDSTRVHDTELLNAFVDFIIAKQNESIRAWRAIIHLPDKRLVPSLIDAFQFGEFVFDPVQALIYIGDEAVSELIETLKHDNYKYRLNASFVLGMIANNDSIKPLQEALQKEKETVVIPALHFALERLQDKNGHLAAILAHLDEKDAKVRQCAARCLSHLTSEIDLNRIAKYLNDSDNIVRVYCINLFADTKQSIPDDIVRLLIERLMLEKNSDVMDKLVAGISKRKDDNLIPKLLLQQLDKANDTQKDKIVTILGNLGVKESADTLLKMLATAQTEFKRSLIWALGQLGAIDALKEMKSVLRSNEKLRRTAAFGIVFLSDVDKDAAQKALSGVEGMDAAMARAILGDQIAIQSIKNGLNSYNSIQNIFEALDAAMIVKDKSFKDRLYSLLEYSDVNYYPTDRYVRHTAIDALVRILL